MPPGTTYTDKIQPGLQNTAVAYQFPHAIVSASIPTVKMAQQQRARQHSAEQWESKRETIKDLYIGRNMTVAQVCETMSSDFAFVINNRQLERQLKAWRLRKNIPSTVSKAIAKAVKDRKRRGKGTSAAEVAGIQLNQTKFQRLVKRYGSKKAIQNEGQGASELSPAPTGPTVRGECAVPLDWSIKSPAPTPYSVTLGGTASNSHTVEPSFSVTLRTSSSRHSLERTPPQTWVESLAGVPAAVPLSAPSPLMPPLSEPRSFPLQSRFLSRQLSFPPRRPGPPSHHQSRNIWSELPDLTAAGADELEAAGYVPNRFQDNILHKTHDGLPELLESDMRLSQPFDDWAVFNLSSGMWTNSSDFVTYVSACVPMPASSHAIPKGMLEEFRLSAELQGCLHVVTLTKLSGLLYELISWCSNDSVQPVINLITITANLSTNLVFDESTQALQAEVFTTYGIILIDQLDRDEEAVSRLSNVIGKSERILGHEHRQTLVAKRGLSKALYKQGKLDAAASLAEHTLSASIRTVGEEHCDSTWNMAALARIYQAQKLPTKVVKLRKRAYTACNRRLGPSHPNTQYALFTLGRAVLALGNLEEAEALVSLSVTQRTQFLGETHHETLVAKFWLARILFDLHRDFEAEKLAKQVLEAQARQTSMAKSDFLGFTLRFASVLERQGRIMEAAVLMKPIIPELSKLMQDSGWNVFITTEWENLMAVRASANQTLSQRSTVDQLQDAFPASFLVGDHSTSKS
ncbi:hypothetical protein BU16DRAFT_564370 [Lophium mytilinum]|uniref:Clr5 domain-containing protein n=1 Tax=Lophium mytilinum TaxID=390894 RepID=A0A6A6QKU5_9PEZI|nr:hypothetical protein BU16DRAFT_564370 [Lophium mytilinum]